MEKNFTPLNIEVLRPDKKISDTRFESLSNTIFLVLATITVLVISVVLFILIQKSKKGQSAIPSGLPVALAQESHG